MNKLVRLACIGVFISISVLSFGQKEYHPVNLKLPTRWSKDVSPDNALKEYPRPQMTRENWNNLNGLWDYAITDKDAAAPQTYQGKILVPYPIESALSGVQKMLKPTENLWYKRIFSIAPKAGEKTLLHFGAVDNEATVFINGKEAGSHKGGYTEFTIDISSLIKSGDNEIIVKVFDPTDQGVWPHGKQVTNPQGIYYTPSSGIWQTVWLEIVPDNYISSLYFTPDIDKGVLNITINTALPGSVEIAAKDGNKTITTIKGKSGAALQLPVKNAKLWNPADPFLYHLEVTLKGKTPDKVNSYFAMRKISVAKDDKGFNRIMLNNKNYYNLGTLDQGFWPDGLYTAATDDALKFDIEAIKSMGFNMIRKHIKVEPARWYYHADHLGMLVWQDMVNPNQGLPEGAKPAFEQQCKETIAQLHNYPCITTWVLFNEKWGQYDQERLTKWLKTADPSRIVNGHTGEILYVNEQLRSPSPNAYIGADMTDVHSYPDPMNAMQLPGKARVLGEFGGIGVFIPDHQWNTSAAWGYIQEKPASLQAKYAIMTQHLQLLQREGLSASVYTQPFDVETEQNGLMTYDREVIKIPFEDLRKIHAALNPDMGKLPEVAAKNADITEPGLVYSKMLQQYIDGKNDAAFLKRLAMTARQVGDKSGAAEIGKAYISTLKSPLSEEDIISVSEFTTSTKDPGFALIKENADELKKVLGDRPYTVKMMNLILKGEIEPLSQTDNADWNAIAEKVTPYGTPGNEIYLRAKTVYFLNHQDWTNYVPAAKEYLKKYGENVRDNEKKIFQKAIDDHSDNK